MRSFYGRKLSLRVCASIAPTASSATHNDVVALKPVMRAFSVTSAQLKDKTHRPDHGESRRLTFDERADRRAFKGRDQREVKEQLLLEAERYVASEYLEELEVVYSKIKMRCDMLAQRIINIANCLKSLEIDVPMPGGTTKKMVVLQLAEVTKSKPNELEIVPSNSSTSNAILTRVTRFDGSLQVSKDQNKIRVVVPATTTARRDKAAADIRSQIAELKQKLKHARQSGTKVLQQLDIDENTLRTHNTTLDEMTNEFLGEKTIELEQLAEEVMTMGVDESDTSNEGDVSKR